MTRDDLMRLATDRRHQTPELYTPNDYYGHAHVLKQYCGLPETYPLKVTIEHGIMLNDPVDYTWNSDLRSPMPLFLCARPDHAGSYRAQTGKPGIPMGLMINYVTPARMDAESPKPDLLLIPQHSSHLVKSNYDADTFIETVMNQLGSRYKNVAALLYWKDILEGLDETYRAHGVRVVTAGHIYDPDFLPRLKRILLDCEMVATNSIGTHVFYAVLCGKPLWYLDQDVTFHGFNDGVGQQMEGYREVVSSFQDEIRDRFRPLRTILPREDYDYICEVTGQRHVMSVEAMTDLLRQAERLYSRGEGVFPEPQKPKPDSNPAPEPNHKEKTAMNDHQHTNTFICPGTQWYAPVVAGAETFVPFLFNRTVLNDTLAVLKTLPQDDYFRYLTGFIEKGLANFGHYWRYADLATVLLGLSRLLKPESYLEIGIRTGRSMAMVASQTPAVEIVGFDMWAEGYAGMENPGPEKVATTMRNLGHNGRLEFVSGNSHETLPRFFAEHPDMFFDLITVDGDHSEGGARQDILHVLPHLKIGGVLVFDDIAHPKHRYLLRVWHDLLKSQERYSTFEFTELGYGVAFAVRKF